MSRYTYRVVDADVTRQVAQTILAAHGFEVTWTWGEATARRGVRWSRTRPLVRLTLSLFDVGQGGCLQIECDGQPDIQPMLDELFQALLDAGQRRVSTSISTPMGGAPSDPGHSTTTRASSATVSGGDGGDRGCSTSPGHSTTMSGGSRVASGCSTSIGTTEPETSPLRV